MSDATRLSAAEPAMVLFVSGDLVFASRVRAAAQAAGLAFQLSGAVPEDLTRTPQFVILDLATRASAVEPLVQFWQTRCPDAALIAYAPHVQVGRMDAARAAGVPVVMTRGQFDRGLSQLFTPPEADHHSR